MERRVTQTIPDSGAAQKHARQRIARLLASRATVLHREPKVTGRPWSKAASR